MQLYAAWMTIETLKQKKFNDFICNATRNCMITEAKLNYELYNIEDKDVFEDILGKKKKELLFESR